MCERESDDFAREMSSTYTAAVVDSSVKEGEEGWGCGAWGYDACPMVLVCVRVRIALGLLARESPAGGPLCRLIRLFILFSGCDVQ